MLNMCIYNSHRIFASKYQVYQILHRTLSFPTSYTSQILEPLLFSPSEIEDKLTNVLGKK